MYKYNTAVVRFVPLTAKSRQRLSLLRAGRGVHGEVCGRG